MEQACPLTATQPDSCTSTRKFYITCVLNILYMYRLVAINRVNDQKTRPAQILHIDQKWLTIFQIKVSDMFTA